MDDPGLRALLTRYLDGGQIGWTDPTSLWAWQVIRQEEHPTRLMLETARRRLAADDPAQGGADELLRLDDVRDNEHVRGEVTEWARKQTFLAGFEEARDAWNSGDVNTAYDRMMARMEEMQAIRLEVADRSWFFTGFGDRQYRRSIDGDWDCLPVGVSKLDKAMGGGLRRGELEVVMAYSGIGKSFWCVQRGALASRLRLKVLHVPLEGGRSTVEDRYDSYFAETLFNAVRRGDIEAEVVAAMHREYMALKDRLVIRGFGDRDAWAAGYEDILGELGELRRSKGWVPDLIVVDYGDLMRAPGDKEVDRQKVAFRQLKALSERQEYRGHRGYMVVSPTQAQRPSPNADEREHVLKPQQVADCYEKVRVADIILSLNRTNREKETNMARVYLGKYRHSEDGCLVRVRTNYAHGQFCVVGIDEPPPPPPKVGA